MVFLPLNGELTGMQLLMSPKERNRLKIMAQLVDPEIRMTQAQAAAILDRSPRHVRRMVARYRNQGDIGLVHKSRGKPSQRRFPDQVRQQVIWLVAEHYPDFGPTLAVEKLAQCNDLELRRETLRKWMIAEGLWKPKARKACHRQFRQRKACCGGEQKSPPSR